ncbi:hypothetical protein Ndes2526B_g07269 [Nannochloris sp. 'desiccata']|nr:hypothetical protein KSW81_004707 [Chlorella desiccata (nom. nud.)]KAH7618334.1 hypothetical protein NADE_000529 [Chlorella desiccata (nom. nud.)]
MIFPVLLLVCSELTAASRENSEIGTHRNLQLFGGNKNSNTFPWAEQIDPIGYEAHSKMAEWLHAYFKATPYDQLASAPPVLPKINGKASNMHLKPFFKEKESVEDAHVWKNWQWAENSDNCQQMDSALAAATAASAAAPELTITAQTTTRAGTEIPPTREFLIIAPVGSDFNASKWMTHPNLATYDIVALYYGADDTAFSCPLCKAVIPGAGAKWGLLNRFIDKEPTMWAEFSKQYKAVMVADDDVEFFDTCSINRIFEVFNAYKLVLGQPSLCRTPYRSTYWDLLYSNRKETVLRYVTFVEIMAPVFEMDFFNGVVKPSLWNAYTGWGLDFSWPFLLRYPERHIGVIDDVCMRHSQGAGEAKGKNNLYSVPAPFDQREEESRRVAEYGYYPSRVQAMGYDYRTIKARGHVERSVFEGGGVSDEGAVLGPSSGAGSTKDSSHASAFDWLRGAYSDAGKNEERTGLKFSKKGFVAYIVVAVVTVFVAVTLVARKQKRGRHGGQRRSSPKHAMTGLV